MDVIPTLPDGSVGACVTSPPYAMQRSGTYGGIPEKDYPDWTKSWMSALRPKLASDASVLIVIRPHVSKGELSDYVLRTRLALRDDGWIECDEIIWVKPDAPPLGHAKRLRRCWESVLWFSRSRKPYMDQFALGGTSVRACGFAGSLRFGMSSSSPVHEGQKPPGFGRTRGSDVVVAYVGNISRGIMHPAMFPPLLSASLIATFSRNDGLVLDPFCGSGTTCLVAKNMGRRWVGIESNESYVKIASSRLEDAPPSPFSS